MSIAESTETKRAGIQIIFALLCARAKMAISFSQQIAARIEACLLAVMATPLADPQTKIPNAVASCSTLLATACA